MVRHFKVFGVVVAAMLILTAIVAQVAQAAVSVTPAEYPAILTPTANGIATAVTNGGQELRCTEVNGQGTIAEPGVGDTEGMATNISYAGCSAKVGTSILPATVNMTGCTYRPHGGFENEPNHFIEGEVDLVCPVGVTGPDMTVYSSPAKHSNGESLCTFTFEATNDAGGLTGTNTGGSPNTIDLKVVNLQTNVIRDGSLLCGNPTNATLNGEATIKAYEDLSGTEGSQIGVTASE